MKKWCVVGCFLVAISANAGGISPQKGKRTKSGASPDALAGFWGGHAAGKKKKDHDKESLLRFEFGLTAGGATARDKQDHSVAGIYLGAYADFDLWLLKAKGQAMAMKYDDYNMTYEFSGNGSALFAIQLHDVLVRSYSPRGTQARAALGLGGDGKIGNKNYNLALGLSAGAIALRWTPLRGEIGDDLTTGLGPYAGAVMRVKLKRFKNEVRVTVCATSNFGSIDDPEINWDGALDDL